MKGRILAIGIVLALVAGVAYRIQHQEAGDAKTRGGDRALGVRTVPVAVRDFPRVIDLPGTLEAAQQVAIVAQVSGTVLQQHVQEGDTVRAGQVLFSLDARPAQARMAQSQATLTGARAETAEAEQKVQRLQPLMQSGYISRQEFADAQLALEAARARAGTARAELQAAQLDSQYAQIVRRLRVGWGALPCVPAAWCRPAAKALTRILAPVRSTCAPACHSRTGLNWRLRARRARCRPRFSTLPIARCGRVANWSSSMRQVDATTGAVPIKVRLAGASPALLSGQGVRVRLLLGVEPNARVVPEAALQHAQQGTYVYVVRDGRAEVQPVTPTRSLDGEHVVEGELRAGEPVLVEIPQRLKAGGKVRLEGDRR